MVSKFVKPADILYPQVFHTFMAKDKDSDELVEYMVQDLTENKFNLAIEFMIKNQVREETFHKALNLYENDNAVKDARSFYRKILNEKMSLICTKLSSDEIVSVNVMYVKSKGHHEDGAEVMIIKINKENIIN